MTELNQKILTLLQESEGHLTAEEVFLLAKQNKIDVSMASVYRILGKLAEEDFIRRISIAGKPDIFDKTLNEHEHLICKKCGKVSDLHIKDLKEIIIDKTGIEIDDYDLSLSYICDECRNKIN